MDFLNNKTFKHGEGTGDIIYSLPTVMALGGGEYYIFIATERTSVYKVMELQPYISKAHIFTGCLEEYKNLKVDYNLDEFRSQNYNQRILIDCHLSAFNVTFDVTQPFLFNIKPKRVSRIVVNNTGNRFPGNTVDWSVLKKYEKDCVFVGHNIEYEDFTKKYDLDIERYVVKDILEFAQVIKGSNLYIANQSVGFAMAEGMKHPRVLDVYIGPSRQYPQGADGYNSLSNETIERYLK